MGHFKEISVDIREFVDSLITYRREYVHSALVRRFKYDQYVEYGMDIYDEEREKRKKFKINKEKEILDKLTTQLKNAIEDSTQYLTEEYNDQADADDLGIYEGRLELAQELLEYIEGGKHV